MAQGGQRIGQAIVGQVGGAQRRGQEGVKCRLALVGPRTHAIEAMVAAREEVGKPEGRDPAATQTAMVAVHRNVRVQNGGQTEAEHMRQQQRRIVHPCGVDAWLDFVYTASVPDGANPVQI